MKAIDKAIDKALDDLWSELIKLRAGNRCEIERCGKTRPLNSHHVYSRGNRSVRWCVENGYCLCVGHHVGLRFSAHKTPNDFSEWSKKNRGEKWFDLLQAKAHTISKLHPFEKELLKRELQVEVYNLKSAKNEP